MNRRTTSANKIIGSRVYNRKEDDLGRIEDVMIDASKGAIAYLVLSYGGIFGTTLADKRFAVPFEAFVILSNTTNDVVFSLDVEKDFLERAPGFDKDNYPDFADPQFENQLTDYYSPVSHQAA